MFCEEAKRLIVAYVDGELPGEPSLVIGKHLQACPACREIEMETRSLNMLLSRAPGMVAPFDFSSRVLGSMNEKSSYPLLGWVGSHIFASSAFVRIAVFLILSGVTGLGIHYGASISPNQAYGNVNKILQSAEIGHFTSGSVENEYSELMASLCFKDKG